MSDTREALKPCPFCGHTGISTHEGSTFRWMLVECDECGAQGPEVRIKTMGEGTREEWLEQGCKDAIAAWNRRAAPADDVLIDAERLHAAIMNLPIKPGWAGNDLALYSEGHRDARHAAAELLKAKP